MCGRIVSKRSARLHVLRTSHVALCKMPSQTMCSNLIMNRKSYHILTIFFLLVVDPLSAQISISKSQIDQIYTSGNSLRMFRDSTTKTLNIGFLGGPNVYDFSNLPFYFEGRETVSSVAQVPKLAHRFQLSSFTIRQLSDSIGFEYPVFSFANLFWHLEGQAKLCTDSTEFYQHHLTSITFLEFPITYNWISPGQSIRTAETTYVNSIVNQTSSQAITFGAVVDGYGTLKLPNLSLNCLRISSMHLGRSEGYKEYMFLTQEGAIVVARTHSISPDTGFIPIYHLRYAIGGSLVPVQEALNHPVLFSLFQNHPNPFNPSTVIRYQLPVESKVIMKIYNMLGQEVCTLVDEIQDAGFKAVEWSSTNLSSNAIASGVYFYKLEAVPLAESVDPFTQVRKMIIMK